MIIFKRCIASGNYVKYCNDIYDHRNLVFQKEKEFGEWKIEKKLKFDNFYSLKNNLFKITYIFPLIN